MRKCRNWQTSKTKDLVVVTSCGFKSHLPQEAPRIERCGAFSLCRKQSRHHHEETSLPWRACFRFRFMLFSD